MAYRIALQSDGKLLLAGKTRQQSEGFATALVFLRLKRDLSVDASFGSGGQLKQWLKLGADWEEHSMEPVDVSIVPGQILVGATTLNGYFYHQTIMALQNDLIFADPFD